VRQFGNALVRYHPKLVLDLLFDIIKDDYIVKQPDAVVPTDVNFLPKKQYN
jgi:hypothetical protein